MKTVKVKNYNWKMTPGKRSKTNYIVLHHAAAVKASPDDIHQWHSNNGWSGIGYHIYITKTGEAYHGRPLDTIGSHVYGFNSESIGVCFEGNFETEAMSQVQKLKGIEVVNELRTMYPGAKIVGHRDLMATGCPGINFPFEEITNGITPKKELESVNDIVWELNHRGIITDTKLWLKKLAEDTDAYWLARKCANMTKNVGDS